MKNLKRNEKKLQVERNNNNNKLRICSRGPTRRFFFHFFVFVFVAVSVAQFRFGRFDVAPLTTHSNRHPLFIDPLCGCIEEKRERREKRKPYVFIVYLPVASAAAFFLERGR